MEVPATGSWPVITRGQSRSVYRCFRLAIECSGRVTAHSEIGLGTGWRRGLAKFRARAYDSVSGMLPAVTSWARWPERTVTNIASYRLRFRRTANRVLAIWGEREVYDSALGFLSLVLRIHGV